MHHKIPKYKGPITLNVCNATESMTKRIPLIGLSKERPILGDHPKAHIHEIRRISKDQFDCQEW